MNEAMKAANTLLAKPRPDEITEATNPARRAEEDSRAAPGTAADAALIQLGKLIGDLAAEKNKAWEIAIYNQQIVEMIPMGLPDGTGIMGPVSWVAWAKQKLGYGES